MSCEGLTWRAEPCCIIFNVILGTYESRILTLDGRLNDSLTFSKKSIKKKNVQKRHLAKVVLVGVIQVTICMLHYIDHESLKYSATRLLLSLPRALP